uniref:Uncharacterized protein n=1 Tax=Astyanax mexicanus TaxID=7994 RepID=A0A3B1J2X5_ASTMX
YLFYRTLELIDLGGIVDIIDNYDRPGSASTDATYAEAGTYAYAFEDKAGKRIPKAGAKAAAGVGRARAEWSVFEAEAKGPNASAGVHADVLGVGAMARAEIAGASAAAGPLGVKVGLGVDTGVDLSGGSAEVKVLGCGVSVGRKMGISLFGSELSLQLW